MDNCMIAFPSYTYAVKAQRMLRARGYRCELRRREDTEHGCGWDVLVRSDCADVFRLLDYNRIHYTRGAVHDGQL